MSRFQSKGPYIAYDSRSVCIGGFDTLAEAKRACAREELAPCGEWRKSDNSHGVSYFAYGNGCEILAGYDHQRVKLTREEIEKATARFRWREGMR